MSSPELNSLSDPEWAFVPLFDHEWEFIQNHPYNFFSEPNLDDLKKKHRNLNTRSGVFYWELWRRHPYYLRCWRGAFDYFNAPAVDERERQQQTRSLDVLRDMGYPLDAGGKLIFPPFLDVWDEQDVPLCGVSEVYYALLAEELADLPLETREKLAEILRQSEEAPTLRRKIQDLTDPHLHEMSKKYVYINPHAPARAIRDGIDHIVKMRKADLYPPDHPLADLGLLDIRRSDEKIPLYLDVWDQREGWADGKYGVKRDKRLWEIAREQGERLSTVQSRYQAAYQYITGSEYKPTEWRMLFLPFKKSHWQSWRTEKPKGRRSVRTVKQDVSEKVLPLAFSDDEDDIQIWESSQDAIELLAKGYTDEAIANQLKIPKELVQYFAERRDDGL